MRLAPLHVLPVHGAAVPEVVPGAVDPLGIVLGSLVALAVLLLGLALVALLVVLVARVWVRRAAGRVVVRPGAERYATSATLTPVVAAAADLPEAVAEQVEAAPAGLLLVAREEDVLPSAAQLRDAADALGDGATGFVTFADLDTDGAAVRADRHVVLAAPGPLAVRADAVVDAGGWSDDASSPEVEMSARMLRLGWYGLALGQPLGTVCDPVARERQTSWTVLRRHPGLLLPGLRHAGNELRVGERLTLLATTTVAVTAAPSPAERSRARSASTRVLRPLLATAGGAAALVRPRGPRWRRPTVLTSAGVALAVVAAAAVVAVTGTLDGNVGAGRPAAAAAEPGPDQTVALALAGHHLEVRPEGRERAGTAGHVARHRPAKGARAARPAAHRRAHTGAGHRSHAARTAHRAARPARRAARPVQHVARPARRVVRSVARPAARPVARPAAPAPRSAPVRPRQAAAPRPKAAPAVRHAKAPAPAHKPAHGHGGR